MNFSKNEITKMLADSSRIQADMVAETILDNPESFKNLVDLMLDDDGQMAMRVSRVVEICESYKPNLLEPLSVKILNRLPQCKTPGVKRNILKIYTRRDIPENEELKANIMELCFNWMKSPAQPVAVKVLSMMVLERIALKEQWLIPELIYSIEDLLEKEDVFAIQHQGKKTVKKLRKLML